MTKETCNTDRLVKNMLQGLPANGSTTEYALEVNSRIQALHAAYPEISKPYLCRLLRRLGFLHVGRDKHGCIILFNPHYNPDII